MREIRYRIVYQHNETGRITERFVELGQSIPHLGNQWDVIAKDQFTGLHDLEGNEIYEGDKLYYDGEPCPHCKKILYPNTAGEYEVKWDFEEAQWTATNGEDNWMDPSVWKELKIVGNIYEGKVAAADQTD